MRSSLDIGFGFGEIVSLSLSVVVCVRMCARVALHAVCMSNIVGMFWKVDRCVLENCMRVVTSCRHVVTSRWHVVTSSGMLSQVVAVVSNVTGKLQIISEMLCAVDLLYICLQSVWESHMRVVVAVTCVWFGCVMSILQVKKLKGSSRVDSVVYVHA